MGQLVVDLARDRLLLKGDQDVARPVGHRRHLYAHRPPPQARAFDRDLVIDDRRPGRGDLADEAK